MGDPTIPAKSRANGGPFVGRQQTMRHLRAALHDARAGQPRMLLLAGASGIGKTRTADEIAACVRSCDGRVFWGRCYEGEGAPGYWPWVQVVRACINGRPPAAWAAEMGAAAATLAQMVPDLREQMPGLPPLPNLEPAQARFQLFDTVTGFLRQTARARLVLLVLDDLHWADRPSLLLLQFLARQMGDARLLVVGTYRDGELGRCHPLALALAELVREPVVERITLRGLSERDVGRFIELAAGQTPPESFVHAVHEQTEGNPFFVTEMVRLLRPDPSLAQGEEATWTVAIPQGVRDVVGRRLDRLSSDVNRVLGIAAVIGRDFPADVLERVTDLGRERLLELLAEAVEAREIVEMAGAGRYSFAHTLIRETLYAELGPTQRIALHRQVGEAIEALYAATLDRHLAELAHHFFEASYGTGSVHKAADFAEQAGDRARRLLAHEDAVEHYERALQTLDLKEPDDPERRARLLLGLGEAQHDAGEREQAKSTFQRAADLARRLADASMLARAALGCGRSGLVGIELGIFDGALVALLEEALAALDPGDSNLRARLLGNLAMATYWSPARDRSTALSREAIAVARRVGEPATLAAALATMHFQRWPAEETTNQLATAREIVALSAHVGDVEMELQGRVWAIATMTSLGDLAVAREEIEAYARRAEELKQPRYLAFSGIIRAGGRLLTGRFEDAESLMRHAATSCEALTDQAVAQALGVQTFLLRRHRGRLDEIEAPIQGFVEQYPDVPGWRVVLANVYAQLGRHAEARLEFEHVAADRFGAIPTDITWLTVMTLLAEVCAFLGDAERATVLYEMLRPYERHCVALSVAACLGSTARFLGLLAATSGRWDVAEQHFWDAAAQNARIDARPWLAHCWHDLAAMLLARTDGVEKTRALELAARAGESARELGMGALAARAAALVANARQLETGTPSATDGAPPIGVQPPESRCAFLREGDYWTLEYAGSLVRLKEKKGLRYIAQLLRHPMERLRSADLAANSLSGTPSHGIGETGAVLDERAKGDYRRRLIELRRELEESVRLDDRDRASHARYEIEVLDEQLKHAAGLGGRSRKAASQAERARVAVTLAIRSAIQTIRAGHPALGEHLAARIKTGYECVYVPDPAHPITWRV